MAEAEYGTADSWDFLDFPDAAQRAKYFGDNYLLKNIKTVEKCYPAASKCWKQPLNIKKQSLGTYLTTNNPPESRMAFLTASGYSGYFWAHATGSGGWIYIDIDGPKKGPAILGKDVFAFQFCNNTECKAGFHAKGLEAFDTPTREELFVGVTGNTANAAYGCGKAATTYAGMECAAVIIMDGWQIKNDYPW
jgi:hypothetical protein